MTSFMTFFKTALCGLALCLLAACGDDRAAQSEPSRAEPPKAVQLAAETGEMCGGIAGIACSAEGDYCQSEPGVCRNTADYAGTCQPRPEVCTMIYQPVCGCDGRTYGNACQAAAEGASVAHEGECRAGE